MCNSWCAIFPLFLDAADWPKLELHDPPEREICIQVMENNAEKWLSSAVGFCMYATGASFLAREVVELSTRGGSSQIRRSKRADSTRI